MLLLGLLMSQSQHGYQIHDFIEKNLPFLSDMKKPTAYALLDRLSREKYVDVTVKSEGNRPPRKVYSINEKGKKYFYQLLSENLSSADSLFYEGDIGLMFVDHLPQEEILRYLHNRREALIMKQDVISRVPSHEYKKGVTLAFDHKRKMLEAELSFIQEALATLQESSHIKEVE
ncbi:DNA-binding transcriptional regulator, PadR family [Alteribacillus iranensis]|uniref:DNA-binding transcriptional regulator, PadR family n=1 Tax=Alteribacillus iranensis TaxID=930128 RepID=A0A1I2CV36_9BACI|nr:DNA-binding transcriptional regulator, PadR family [Alteribacillus iranensis]